jgi:Zn-dependent protease/predicted transcriptional regulator
MTSQTASGWAINFCNIKGIPIRIHASFMLLIAWVALESGSSHSPVLSEILFILGVFFCILLHELGHALTAKRFDIPTKDITLYPFGGIASLSGTPSPLGELFISSAGPIVNFVLAGILYLLLPQSPPTIHEATGHLFVEFPKSIPERLLVANLILGIFNLIPALPMDGGRILRSALELAGVKAATTIASRLSQVISLAFIAIGLYSGDLILLFIASLVFVGASQEQLRGKLAKTAEGFAVSDALISKELLVELPHGITVFQAAKLATRSAQSIFPVLLGQEVIGVVPRETLFAAGLQVKNPDAEMRYVGDLMNREFSSVCESDSLAQILEKISEGKKPPYIVLSKDSKEFLGILEYDRLIEFLFLCETPVDDEPPTEKSDDDES